MNARRSTSAGFSLIELVIVVAILGILSVMALQVFGPQDGKARDARRMANIDYIQNKIEIYMTEQGAYPVVAGTGATGYEQVRDVLADAYEERIRDIADPGLLEYTFENTASNFCLCAELEYGAEANSGANCAFGGSTHYCVKGIQ